ncbi:MAG: IS1595 family transposase [Chloroflexota bacterium]|nr:IS1595 family transposase [Chloroflexota bacterium]
MTKKGPGKSYRKGMSLIEAVQQFSDEEAAHQWLVERRWPEGIRCLACEGENVKRRKSQRKTPVLHCNDCKYEFTVKTDTVMHNSKLPLSKWVLAFYLFSTSIKGVSSMKLHRDLNITQKNAWHMAHRIRETWDTGTVVFAGPVEADEVYIGGLEKNKHANKKMKAGRGVAGKKPVVGVIDRPTNQIVTQVVDSTDKETLQGFVEGHTQEGAQVYTDDHRGYQGIARAHEVVKHSSGEYVKEQAHTAGMDSHWAMFRRGLTGTYHHVSEKHLQRYTTEFAGRHNSRPLDTIDQMTVMAQGSVGKRLPYKELIAE